MNTDFSLQTKYIATTVGDFTTINGLNFLDTSNLEPSKDRGFFANTGSSLISKNSFVIGTEFSVRLYAHPKVDGIIITIGDFLIIDMSGGSIRVHHILLNQNGYTEEWLFSLVLYIGYTWISINLEISQSSAETVTLTLTCNSVVQTVTKNNFELPKREAVYVYMGTIIVGCPTAHTFFYNIEVANTLGLMPYASLNLPMCSFSQFWTGTACQACSSTCNPRIQCVSASTCSTCKSADCSDCVGFGPNDCLACATGGIPPACCDSMCTVCTSISACTSCISGTLEVGGMCLLGAPYGITGSVLVDGTVILQRFNGNFGSFGLFYSGSNPNTYYPFASPESDDPIPSYLRGIYFDGDDAVHFGQNIILAQSFAISVLLRPSSTESMTILTLGNWIELSSSTSPVTLLLTQPDGTTVVYTYTGLSTFISWQHISISVNYNAGLSTVSIYSELIVIISATSTGFLRMPETPFQLGGTNTAQPYTGFIYSLYVYNYPSTQFLGYYFTLCVHPTDTGCLWDCDYLYYLSNTGYTQCQSKCTNGCITESICSFCIDSACSQCPSFSPNSCTLCMPLAKLTVSHTCSCSSGAFFDAGSNCCKLIPQCYDGCASCVNLNFQGCTTCLPGYIMFLSTCLLFCPTGYSLSNDRCVLEKTLVFDMLFDAIQGTVYDSQSNIPAITGTSEIFYPDYEENDPYATDGRGYYFNGISSIMRLPEFEYSAPSLILGPEFSIELWMMPMQAYGTIISKQMTSTYQSLFQLSLSSSSLVFTMRTPFYNTIATYIIKNIPLGSWLYLGLSMKFSGPGYFDLYYCYNYDNKDIGPGTSYLADMASGFTMTIGAQKYSEEEYTDYFNGFVYQIHIYSIGISYSDLDYFSCVGNCSVCSFEGMCFSRCPIDSFGAENCTLCEDNCTFGCRSLGSNCSLCNNLLCSKCSELNSCETCVAGAEIVNNTCQCETGLVASSSSCTECKGILTDNVCEVCEGSVFNGECVKCSDGCSACDSAGCISCMGEMKLVGGKCSCDTGYEGVNCTQAELFLEVATNNLNEIFLIFTENLKEDLVLEDMDIYSNDLDLNLSLTQWSRSKYIINITASTDIKEGTPLNINFTTDIYSDSYAKLLKTNYTLLLSQYNVTKPSTTAESFQSAAEYMVTVLTAMAASLSLASLNPSSLWNFISTIQLLVFIYLANIPLSDRTKGFLIGLKKYNPFPNLFQYTGVYQGTPHRFTKAVELGFSTNSIFMNIGNIVSLFSCLIFMYLLVRILLSVTAFKCLQESKIIKHMREFCSKYKYGFYIRFLIQAYIEIEVACLIALYSSRFSTLNQAYNVYFAIFFLVIDYLASPSDCSSMHLSFIFNSI